MQTSIDDIITHFKNIIAEETKAQASEVNEDDTFHELGLDSISAVFIMEDVETKYDVSLSPLDFWDYPTIHLLASHVSTLIKS